MLMVNAALRPSAAAILRHPWLRLRRESVPKAKMLRLLRNIKSNASESNFKRMVMRVIAQQLPAESSEIRIIERAFRFFDRNGDGVLGVPEIVVGVKKLDLLNEKETKEINKALELIDRDGSQTVNLQEFVAGALDSKRCLSSANLWHAFNAFDNDGNGSITIDEVEEIVRKYEAGLLAKDQVDGIVRRVKRELASAVPDGKIDFSQFVYIMSTPPSEPSRSLAVQRDLYSFAYACLGIDCYNVRKIEPKKWNWQQAARSPHSVYKRASLVVAGRKQSKGDPPLPSPVSGRGSQGESDGGSRSGRGSKEQPRRSSKASRESR